MWTIELLNNDVLDELNALPEDQQAKFTWITDIIKEHGLQNVRKPYVKHLEQGLWEIRMKGRDGISRAFYVVAKPKRVVVVRFFKKNTKDITQRNQARTGKGKGGHMINFNDVKKEWMKNPKFVEEYEALAPEFAVASALIRARARAGMTQADVAAKMQVTQSRIAKMEGGINVSVDALKRYAEATGATLNISLDPTG